MNINKLALIIFFSFSSIVSASYEAKKAGMSPERLDKIAPLLSKYIDKNRLPGLITAVSRKGQLVHFEVQGYSDIENQVGGEAILDLPNC